MKLSDIVRLPEKKSCGFRIDEPIVIPLGVPTGVPVHEVAFGFNSGYNQLIDDIANLEITVDEEAIAKIIEEYAVMGKLQIDEPALTYPERIEFRRIGSWKTICYLTASAIASQLPKILKRKEK